MDTLDPQNIELLSLEEIAAHLSERSSAFLLYILPLGPGSRLESFSCEYAEDVNSMMEVVACAVEDLFPDDEDDE